MSESISFLIPGKPVSSNHQARIGVIAIRGGASTTYRGRMYKSSEAALYQSTVYALAHVAASAAKWKWPYYAEVDLVVFNIKQDCDNVPKLIMDGMQGVMYAVDSRVKRLLISQHRDKMGPRIMVYVRALGYEEARNRGFVVPRSER